jgi:YggT family protein
MCPQTPPDSESTEPAMYILLEALNILIQIYTWIIIARVVLSWLIGFNVVNPYNPAVRAVNGICYQLTEPLLGPIRRMLPDLGGLDISPIVLLLLVQFAFTFLVKALTGTL